MPRSLKERISAYLKKQGDWVASTEVERIVTTHTQYSASNAARRLRDLFEEGDAIRTYRIVNGKKLAYYKYQNQPTIAEVQKAALEMWEAIK